MALFKGKRVAVIGGGNSGVEAAIDLAGIVTHVTLLEFGDSLRADAVLQKKLHSLPNVRVITNAQTTEVTGDGQKVNGLSYQERITGETHHVALEGIFVQIGLLPNTDWLKDSIALSSRGEIGGCQGQTSARACLPLAMPPRHRTSRSSSPWAKAPRPACLLLIT
jgi:alkyl hydroperoxide reductase subunit F